MIILRIFFPFVFGVFVLLSGVGSVLSAEPNATLAEVLRSHTSSRQLIQTFSCVVDFELTRTGGDIERESCHFWYSDGSVRLRSESGPVRFDSVWQDSVRTRVESSSANGQDRHGATRSARSTPHTHRCDAFTAALLVVCPPESIAAVPLDTLVNLATSIEEVSIDKKDGNELVTVRLFFDRSKLIETPAYLEVTLDSKVNYLIRKVVNSDKPSPSRSSRVSSEEVIKFLEPVSGIFVPELVKGEYRIDSIRATGKNTSRLHQVKVNTPIPTSTFRLTFPHAVSMVDEIKGTTYQVDSRGNPISPEKPVARVQFPAPLTPEDADTPGPTQTTEETVSNTPYFLLLLASLACIVIGLFFLRKRSSSSQGS
jgi:hypothetical protein